MDPELPLCLVFQPSQKPAPKANIHHFGFRYRKIQEQYYLLSRKIISREIIFQQYYISLDIIYYFAMSLNAIMHQFHNGIHLAGVHLVRYIAVRQRAVRHLNLCQHTVRLWPRITLLVNCASGRGLGTRLPPHWFKTVL